MHVYYVERIFSRPEPLRRVGLVASMHHERMDGSGYHRGASGAVLTNPCRILAVADAYHAMCQPRPYREPLSPAQAAGEIRADVAAGRLDPAAAQAVLEVAGHGGRAIRSAGQSGLTPREREVLALLAVGRPTRPSHAGWASAPRPWATTWNTSTRSWESAIVRAPPSSRCSTASWVRSLPGSS